MPPPVAAADPPTRSCDDRPVRDRMPGWNHGRNRVAADAPGLFSLLHEPRSTRTKSAPA